MSMENRTSFQASQVADDDMICAHNLADGGRITVLDRMTGFGWRDIETGYRCPSGQFWLASGRVDIRDHLEEFDSEDEMAEWVKQRANNCTGGHWGKVGLSYEYLMARENWRPAPMSKQLSGGRGD